MASILGIDTIQHQSGTTALTIDNNGHVSGQTKLASVTPIDLTSHTSGYTFTNIPSVYNRLTLMVYGWSVSATAELWIRLGTSSGIITAYNYVKHSQYWNTADNVGTDTSGTGDNAFKWEGWNGAGNVQHLNATFTHNGGNIWFMQSSAFAGALDGHMDYYQVFQGLIDTGATLTQLQILPEANSIDAGTVNLMYG